mmetsp:Transcript_5826/g.13673  ORF Transcript_5826/g.13673 Transcript_5826/m.13673 type:complete len:282 (+) Transcript_5826:454-1299(+)
MCLQAHLSHHRLGDLCHLITWHSADACIEGQGLPHRELVRQGIELRTVAQPTACCVPVVLHAGSSDEDVTVGHFSVSCDHAHRRRLPCAVHAKQPKTLAGGHADTDAADGSVGHCVPQARGAREALLQVVDDQAVPKPRLGRAHGGLHPRALRQDSLILHLGPFLSRAGALQNSSQSPGFEASQEAAPLDEEAQEEPGRGHEHQVEDVMAGDIPAEWVFEAETPLLVDADPKLLVGEVGIVVHRDVQQSTAEAVIWQGPREDRLTKIQDRHERGELFHKGL